MANVLNISDINAVRAMERELLIRYSLTLSGNYVQAGARGTNVGEVINLGAALNPGFAPRAFFGQKGPARGYFLQGPGGGYSINIRPGADSQHWVLQVYNSTTGNELAAGAYPAAISGDLDMVLEFSGRSFD